MKVRLTNRKQKLSKY